MLECFSQENFFADDQERRAASETALRWMRAVETLDLTNLQRNPVTAKLEEADGELGFVEGAATLLEQEITEQEEEHLRKLYTYWSDKTTAAATTDVDSQADLDDPAELDELDDWDDEEE